ncbi:hypothetical protein [Novipirellula caenicola]|uniref:Uncharacterized protein n=1 Tax=Novipirellula caenicola TaxID=1536901 RepID=A0ABP9VQ69_9BACT
MKPSDDDKLDQTLHNWRSGLEPTQAQRDRMQSRFLDEFSAGPDPSTASVTLPPNGTSPYASGSWIRVAACLAVGVCIVFVMFAWQYLSKPNPAGAIVDSEPAPQSSWSFTPEELRRSEVLVCEFDRVFEHQVRSIHQRGQTVEVDLVNQTVARSETPRVIVRFVLQQRNTNTAWKTVQSEEWIGSQDHQFHLSNISDIEVQTWSHLLPDDSLWIELTVSSPDDVAEQRTRHCIANQPGIVWQRNRGDQQWQLVVVHELLKPCDGELI